MPCCSHESKESTCTTHAKPHACTARPSCCKVIAAGVFAAIVIYLFDWFWHGQYLEPIYVLTSELWRPMPEMESLGLLGAGMTLALGILLSYIFSLNFENRGIAEGIRFGVIVGALLGLQQSMAYLYLPVSPNLATLWLLGWIVEGVFVGIALALSHIAFQKNHKCCKPC